MPQNYAEGQRLQGSDGNVYVMHNGVPVLESTVPSAPRTFGTPDPTQPYKVPEVQSKIANTQTDTATANAKLPYVAPQAAEEVRNKQLTNQELEQKISAGPPVQSPQLQLKAQVRGALNLLDNLDKQEALWRDKYVNNGPLDTLGRMLPTPTNRNFDQFSKNELVSGKAFLRVPGEGSSSDRDVTNYTDLLPQSDSYDATNINRFQNLREQANAVLRDAGMAERHSNVITPDGRVYTGPVDSKGHPTASGAPPMSGGGGGAPNGGGPTGPQSNPLNYAQGQYGDATTTQVAGATKSIPNQLGIQFMNGLNSLFHAGASDDRIRAYASQFGVSAEPQLDYRRKNPGFRGSIPVTPGGLSLTVPNDSVMSRVAGAMAGSPTGTFVGEAGNAAAAGIPQWLAASVSDNPDLVRARFGVARAMNPGAAVGGQLVGGTLGAIGGESAALRGAGALGKALNAGEGAQGVLNFGGRRLADAAFGGTSGFTGAEPGQGGSGAVKGALAGTFGGLMGEGAGRYAIEPTTRPIGRLFGAPRAPDAPDRAIMKAVGNNAPDINAQLSEAQGLNLPMTLADTNPALRSLAGAAVRRSPNASGVAENVLLPRNRGQIDRLAAAVNRNLGPTENIPQLQDNLIQAARAKAGPLYDQAYAAPPATSPQITSILNTPFGKSALGRAVNIAKNERVDPNTLSVDFNAAGDPIMKSVPNMRTLDYTKRGMDDVLEQYRNPMTGRLQLDEAGRAQNGVRADFLKELDRINPAYGQARAAYAGPAAERDLINTGQDAFSAVPDQLSYNLQNVPADKMPMVQLGYRDALMQRANSVRGSSNPFDATLGTPAAEMRLNAVYPDSQGPANLLRQRDLERQMQATSNDILGNSKTAQRGIADEAFSGEDLPQIALDTGLNLATGQVPIGTVVKLGTGQALRDALKFGVGKRAVKKADILTPTLLNPDPAASSAELSDILTRSQGYRDYVARRRGLFGAPMGAIGAGALTGYSVAN